MLSTVPRRWGAPRAPWRRPSTSVTMFGRTRSVLRNPLSQRVLQALRVLLMSACASPVTALAYRRSGRSGPSREPVPVPSWCRSLLSRTGCRRGRRRHRRGFRSWCRLLAWSNTAETPSSPRWVSAECRSTATCPPAQLLSRRAWCMDPFIKRCLSMMACRAPLRGQAFWMLP